VQTLGPQVETPELEVEKRVSDRTHNLFDTVQNRITEAHI
jgi:hypothetical protein